jgi:DMSO/TMAO reductase YedYZ heme-binding membrane subunit
LNNSTVGWLVLGIFAAIVIFDTLLALDGKPSNTISANARRLGRYWPPFRLLVTFATGLTIGHLWW